MNWLKLQNLSQLDEIQAVSEQQNVLIFKHSTTCGVSAMALKGLERAWVEEEMSDIVPYYLDLKAHRDVSNRIAELFQVKHESPQILLISAGKAVYHASHSEIAYDDIKEKVA